MSPSPLLARLDETVRAVRARLPSAAPKVGLVLGSGLGAFGDSLGSLVKIPYQELPHMPASQVIGHAGNLCFGVVRGVPVVCMQGRVHLYEGHPVSAVVHGVRSMARLGVKTVLLTNAAGGIEPGWSAGDLMLVNDHLNLTGTSPLIGPNDDTLGPRFPDMSRAYDETLRAALKEVAMVSGIGLREGVYAGLLGPTYETPAEVRMLRRLGAHAVGMSTVSEVIALRHMGIRCGALSCITNLAAGITSAALDHKEVEETARARRTELLTLLAGWIERAGGDVKKSAKGDEQIERLVTAARAARDRAYAPYSKYKVGAAILTKSGAVFTGVNVENASYPAGMCAERGAIAAMVAAGEREPIVCAVATGGAKPGSPCGFCRQVLREFARDMEIVLVAEERGRLSRRGTTLGKLLPDAFDGSALKRASPRRAGPG